MKTAPPLRTALGGLEKAFASMTFSKPQHLLVAGGRSDPCSQVGRGAGRGEVAHNCDSWDVAPGLVHAHLTRQPSFRTPLSCLLISQTQARQLCGVNFGSIHVIYLKPETVTY